MKNNILEFIKIIKQFQFILNKKQKQKCFLAMILIIIGSLFETLGVSLIVPFVQAMLVPDKLMKNEYIQDIMKFCNINSGTALIVLMGIGLIFIYLIKNIYLTFLSYYQIKFQCKIQKELSVNMLDLYMRRPYTFFVEKNSGELLRGITSDVDGVYSILDLSFKMIAELLTALMICVFIFITNATLAIAIIFLAGGCLVGITLGFKRVLKIMGINQQKFGAQKYKHAYESINGAKEIKVMHREKYFLKTYENSYENYQKTIISNKFATSCPERIIEAVCICGLIGMVCFQILLGRDSVSFVPQLAAFAVAAFRILPSTSRISSNFNQLIFYRPTLNSLYNNFETVYKIEDKKKKDSRHINEITFTDRFEIRNLRWKYSNTDRYIIDNGSIVINKGNAVALIGASGAGKTTLANIIMGLLEPQEGKILLDGEDISEFLEQWQELIGYVPQSVFLTDDTIRNNIAFGIEESKISDEVVWKVLKKSQMYEFVSNLPDGLDTIVGEQGIKFSGGQRQRIAIARALYSDPPILVLDEATSALDNDTERGIMEAIDSLYGEKTLVIVAHRLSTVRKCDTIYKIEGGRINRQNKEDLYN